MAFGSIFGCDLARFQGRPPFDDLIAKGCSFFITKATHGAGAGDPSFADNWRELAQRKSKARRGPYFWLVPSASPDAHVGRHFDVVEAAGYAGDDFAPMIDFEDPGFAALGPAGALHQLERTITLIQARGRTPLVYTGTYFWRQYVGDLDSELAASCPLVFAQYPPSWKGKPDDYVAAIRALPPHIGLPLPWAKRGLDATIWQCDGDGGLRMPNGVDADFDVLREGVDLDSLTGITEAERVPYTPEGPAHTLAEDARADAEESEP